MSAEATKWARLGCHDGLMSASTGNCPVIPTGIDPDCKRAWFQAWALCYNCEIFALGGATDSAAGMVSGENPEPGGGFRHETPAPSQPRTFDGAAYLRRNFNRR